MKMKKVESGRDGEVSQCSFVGNDWWPDAGPWQPALNLSSCLSWLSQNILILKMMPIGDVSSLKLHVGH